MKKLAVVLLLGLPVIASASNCDEISANIAEKIKNNGVNENSFQLKLVPQDEQNIEGKIVGSCDRGKQSIVYIRTPSSKSVKDEPETPVEITPQPVESDSPSNDPVQTPASAPVEKVQTPEPTSTESQETEQKAE